MTHNDQKRSRSTGRDLYDEASGILKAELARRNVSYVMLATMLGDETPQQLRTRINRGSFTFGFLIRVMRALGAEEVRIAALSKPPALPGDGKS